MGLGIAVSSVYIMRRGNMADKGVKFMRAMIGGTSLVTLMGFTTSLWQLLVLGFVMGLCGGFFINMNQGLIQANTPQDVMGRVMGLYALVSAGLTPFGALGMGVLAEATSTGTAMNIVDSEKASTERPISTSWQSAYVLSLPPLSSIMQSYFGFRRCRDSAKIPRRSSMSLK